MFLSFSDTILKEVEATKDQMHTKAVAIEEVGCMFEILSMNQLRMILLLRSFFTP
jgi:hypothetical protein